MCTAQCDGWVKWGRPGRDRLGRWLLWGVAKAVHSTISSRPMLQMRCCFQYHSRADPGDPCSPPLQVWTRPVHVHVHRLAEAPAAPGSGYIQVANRGIFHRIQEARGVAVEPTVGGRWPRGGCGRLGQPGYPAKGSQAYVCLSLSHKLVPLFPLLLSFPRDRAELSLCLCLSHGCGEGQGRSWSSAAISSRP